MQAIRDPLLLRRFAASVIGAGLLAASSFAVAASSEAEAQYQREVQVCNSGKSNQDKATCLREAGAARDEARRNRLSDGQASQYEKNSLARCDALPAKDRDECVARMTKGTTSGSVQGGGVIREHRTVVPAP